MLSSVRLAPDVVPRRAALNDSWLVILFGILAFFAVLCVYVMLMTAFPDKNLLEIFEDVTAK
jgi:hypothetical protein